MFIETCYYRINSIKGTSRVKQELRLLSKAYTYYASPSFFIFFWTLQMSSLFFYVQYSSNSFTTKFKTKKF